MTQAAPRSIEMLVQVPRDRMGLLDGILDGYDGLAVASAACAGRGVVRIDVPAARVAELESLLGELAAELPLRRLPDGTDPRTVEVPERFRPGARPRPSARSRRKRRRRRARDSY